MTMQEKWEDSYNTNYANHILNGKSPRIAQKMAAEAADRNLAQHVQHIVNCDDCHLGTCTDH